MANKSQAIHGNYEGYDQAIKRIVVILVVLKQEQNPAAHFEDARRWLENATWESGDAARAFRQLANAQRFAQLQETKAARNELLSLVNFLATQRRLALAKTDESKSVKKTVLQNLVTRVSISQTTRPQDDSLLSCRRSTFWEAWRPRTNRRRRTLKPAWID